MARPSRHPLCSLLGGHPPAVKAGKMRVSKKQGNEENAHIEKKVKKSSNDKISSITSLGKMQVMNVLFSGALEKLSRDFPLAPAQMAEHKPRLLLDKPLMPKRIYHLQQPRKC